MTTLLIDILVAALLTGCLVSWIVILLTKWRVLEWLQVHGTRLVSELASCHFCLSWWLSWGVVAVALIITGWWWLVAVPFFSTTIGRFLCQ